MKVRWMDESLRFRITPTELDALLVGERVTSTLFFPGGGDWTASLVTSNGRTALHSRAGHVQLRLSAADVELLAEPDREGVYFAMDEPLPLRYFVEKDFPCAHPHAEEACEPETERFAPTESYLRRKHGELAGLDAA